MVQAGTGTSAAAAAGAATIVRERVVTATRASLLRLAGGGGGGVARTAAAEAGTATSGADGRGASCASSTSSTVASGADDDGDCARWTRGLIDVVSSSSVSFPNGGSRHDVEVRAALALFHRLRRGRQLQQQHQQQQHQQSRKRETGQRKRHRASEPNSSEGNSATVIDIVSDLGTRRTIDSAKSLADLLALELEKELGADPPSERGDVPTPGDDRALFSDVRSNASGIVCLVSRARARELRAAGRLPCPRCAEWFKGSKGLWWHLLQVHGVEYASAAENAASATNVLALVPFRGGGDGPMPETPEEDVVGLYQEDDGSAEGEIDAFKMVKSRRFGDLVDLVEDGSFDPKTALDRNGASALHWAAGCGCLDIATYLVEKCGLCPNGAQKGKRSFRGRTPLHWAARNGQLPVVEYLVIACRVDIDAETSDGTTAFCWASWQGHLEVMKFLRLSGCDINAINSYGCDAVLWAAQGYGTAEIMAWLLDSGSDFRRVNANGHGALHKAAQRGSENVARWLVGRFLLDANFDGYGMLIGPDKEGCCPSDLCGANGHEELAQWIANREYEYFARLMSAPLTDDPLHDNTRLPGWLQEELEVSKVTCRATLHADRDARQWGAGRGVQRIASQLMERLAARTSSAKLPVNDWKDID